MFEPARAMQVGAAFAVIYEITFFLGMYMMASRATGIFGIGIRLSDASVGDLFKILIVGLIPFASLVGAGVLARKVFHGNGVLAGDVYTAGASLLPFGLAVLATARRLGFLSNNFAFPALAMTQIKNCRWPIGY